MKAGYAKKEITPPLGANLNGYYRERYADRVIAPLFVTCAAFSDGERQILAVSLDISEILQKDTTELRRELARETGLAYEAIYLSCIHTHTAPVISEIRGFFKRDEAYYAFFRKQLCLCAKEALADLKEARVSTATGKAEGISFVRRFRRKDGSCVTNPRLEEMDQIEGPIGTPDETVQLIKLERKGASDLAIVSFATHPDTIGGTGICPDWPGFMRDAVEAALADEAEGQGVRVIFFNGCQGDVNHHDKMGGVVRKGVKHSRHMGRVLAGAVLSVYTYTKPMTVTRVFYGEKDATVPVAKGSAEQVRIAREIQEKYLKNEDISAYPFDIVMARKYLRLEDSEPQIRVNVTCIGFGDLALVGLPGEPFTELGRLLRAESPFGITLPCCNTNGSEGYFPTDEALRETGYESASSLFLPGTAPALVGTSLTLLRELANQQA